MLHLSVEDVQKLLSPDLAGEGRLNVANKVVGRYDSGEYNPTEEIIAEQIFRLLVRDTEIKVRATIAEHLKSNRQLPHDIVMTMAQDVEDIVAVPVLKYSEVLTQEDLLELVGGTEATSRHVAMSERKSVPHALAEQLLARGKPEVATALLHNQGAQLEEKDLAALLEKFSSNSNIMQELAERANLPLPIAEKVVAHVSESVGAHLRRKYHLDGSHALQEGVEHAREASTLALLEHHPSHYEVGKLVDQLALFARLTPSLILTALAHGHTFFFEASLARLSGINLNNAQKLINDRGDLGFRAVYNKAGLSPAMFNAVRMLFLTVQEVHAADGNLAASEFSHRVLERLLQVSETSSEENLSYLLALIQGGTR